MRVIWGLMLAAAPLLRTEILISGHSCTAEMTACQDDNICATCYNNATMDGTCDRDTTDCAGVADYYCCFAGDACSDNTLLVDYINCEIELDSCTLTDVCDYDISTAASGGDPDDEEECTVEYTACQNDTACATCYNNATMDGTCDRDTTNCAGVADYYCCFAGDACSDNTLLVDYINCEIELDSCTLTDVCDYDISTAASGGDPDDEEECTVEYTACQNDTACATCYNNATMDGTCDRNTTDCAGVADYYCCVAGDACSNNTLLVDYINCGIEMVSCTLTDVCDYNNSTVSGGEDDDDWDMCAVEYTACQNDTACATCFNNATMDGTCDRNATDCASEADHYCCLAGDACSSNTLLVDYINCEIDDESCTLTDVCDYASPTPSPVTPEETPSPDFSGGASSRTSPWSFGAGIFVAGAAVLLTKRIG